MTSAPWPFARGPISCTGFTVPDGVSEWTTATTFASGWAARARCTSPGSTASS
jgi:hypothetical protein